MIAIARPKYTAELCWNDRDSVTLDTAGVCGNDRDSATLDTAELCWNDRDSATMDTAGYAEMIANSVI